MNLINTEVSDLKLKMGDLDKRLTETEKSCQFISNSNEQSKKDVKKPKKTCQIYKIAAKDYKWIQIHRNKTMKKWTQN